jgi:imidazolonepropionase
MWRIKLGSITVGKKANLLFVKPIPSLAYLPYSFGTNLIDDCNDQWGVHFLSLSG